MTGSCHIIELALLTVLFTVMAGYFLICWRWIRRP